MSASDLPSDALGATSASLAASLSTVKDSDRTPNGGVGGGTSVVEIASKSWVLVSASLYASGLIISNIDAQRYGRYSSGLVEAQYVLVGLLWLCLILFGGALTKTALLWVNSNGPWRGISTRQYAQRSVRVLGGLLGLLTVYGQTMSLLGGRSWFSSWWWLTLLILGTAPITVRDLFIKTWMETSDAARPGCSFFERIRHLDSIQLSKRVLFFLGTISIYATFVYPHLSPAFGGGRPPIVELIITPEQQQLYRSTVGIKVDASGRMEPLALVGESDQYFIVASLNSQWWALGPRTVLVRKNLVLVVIYRH